MTAVLRPMKPEQFSDLGMYGDREIFDKRLKEGYTKIAFGVGEWVGDFRIVRLWVFYHPDGRIATYEHPKMQESNWTVRGNPFEAWYNERQFNQYKIKRRITVGSKCSLREVLELWAK